MHIFINFSLSSHFCFEYFIYGNVYTIFKTLQNFAYFAFPNVAKICAGVKSVYLNISAHDEMQTKVFTIFFAYFLLPNVAKMATPKYAKFFMKKRVFLSW